MKIYETNIIENVARLYSRSVVNDLLFDRTTRKNIIWATDEYMELGVGYGATCQVMYSAITGNHSGVIKPRVTKAIESQADRTKKKAEVMTPAWICNKMNNDQDQVWFQRKTGQCAFNVENGSSWKTVDGPVRFTNKRFHWRLYVDNRRLEITCGEAPFITSRYDTTTGEMIPVKDRIGFLDRKLRVVGENTNDEGEWFKWALRALQATYGYEWQGDSLLIARCNVIQTFSEHMEDRWGRRPTDKEAKQASLIVSWNLWQMDGLKGSVPLGTPREEHRQLTFFDLLGETDTNENEVPYCKIRDWRSNKAQTYISLKDGASK